MFKSTMPGKFGKKKKYKPTASARKSRRKSGKKNGKRKPCSRIKATKRTFTDFRGAIEKVFH